MRIKNLIQRLLVGSLLILPFSNSWAEMTIVDEGHVLQELAYRVDPMPFEQAMACQKTTKFSAQASACEVKCNARGCTTKCSYPATGSMTYEWGTEECSDQSVSIYGNGFAATLSKDEYIQGGNTWLLGLLKNLGHFIHPEGKLILHSIMMRQFNQIQNGEPSTFFGVMIFVDLELLPGTNHLGIEIGIDPSSHGLDQIILVRLDNKDVFLKRKGILDVTH